ncbi:MAG: imelysin [Lewinellaceae bacterium]|nr:hypothetical protein [Saprospiraceae bacterium]MCB9336729.1 imelysin [Lewinellaceae bacterium]
MKFNHYLSVLAFSLFLASCGDDDTGTGTADYADVLANVGTNVFLKTYEDLKDRAIQLQNATAALEALPNSANLEAARAAWVAARSPWEQSEGFLFGPVDQEGLDPSLDSWPVNVTDLNNVLASSNALTVDFLKAQEGTLKGFHTIEYLLWGTDGNKQPDTFTEREYEYLAACAGALAADAAALYDLWSPAGGNYVKQVTDAGNGSNIYISQKAALEEMANGLIVIADEVANGKINDPFSQKDLSLEESRFSANSKADFADNIRSIQNIYTGKYGSGGNGNGIANIIKAKNVALDARVYAEIAVAIQAIEAIPGTFSDAVFNAGTAVENAQQQVRGLLSTLESEVLPIISNL